MTTYLTDSEGKFIPATQRPDGTWRKARRVRNGYVPQEEVPLYESKGKQFAQRKPTLPPGLHPVVSDKPNKTKKDAAAVTPTSNSKNYQQQQQALPGVLKLPTNAYITSFIPVTTTMTPLYNTNKSSHSSITATTPTTTTTATTTANNGGHKSKASIHTNSPHCNSDLAENFKDQLRINEEVPDSQKRMKKLRKKLREIEQIEEKMKSGALKSPEKDQLDKVKRKKQIQKELKQLEAEQQQQLQPTTEVNEGQQQHTT